MAQEVFIARESSVNMLNAISTTPRRQEEQTEHTPVSHDDVEIQKNGLPILFKRGYNKTPNEIVAYQDALTKWCGYTYNTIVDAQLGRTPVEYQEYDYENLMKAMMLEEFIERSPKWKGGTTYRGIVLKPHQMRKIKVGSTIEAARGSLAAWSTNKESAVDASKHLWHKDKQVVLVCKDAQYGTSVRAWSHISESEVLCSSRCRYKVDRIRYGRGEEKGYTFIEVSPTTNGKVNTGTIKDWTEAKKRLKQYING